MQIEANGIRIHYELEGEEGPVAVMSHSLGCSNEMWEPQRASLLGAGMRVLRYDTRGHGATEATAGPYTLDDLGDDAIGLLDALDLGAVHWVGLSLGGMIGQNLALRYPDRLDSAALCDTMSVLPPGGERMWRERIDTATAGGMEPLAEPTMERWFTQPYRERHPERVDVIRQQFLRTPVAGYCGCCEAIMKLNYLELLANIAIPTKIIVGEDDMGTPVAASEAMHERIPRSTLTVIPAAAHLSNLEQPAAFDEALLGFLAEVR